MEIVKPTHEDAALPVIEDVAELNVEAEEQLTGNVEEGEANE